MESNHRHQVIFYITVALPLSYSTSGLLNNEKQKKYIKCITLIGLETGGNRTHISSLELKNNAVSNVTALHF